MIKANLAKKIVEVSGNDMDYIPEFMTLTWKITQSIPQEMHGLMKEAFEDAMQMKECPQMDCEEDFTRQMRELLGAKNEPKEEDPLDAEDAEYLFRKISLAMKAGNAILLSYDNYGMDVHIAVGKFDKTKGFDEAFRMYAGEKEEREVYESCIEYLEELIDEGIKDGN